MHLFTNLIYESNIIMCGFNIATNHSTNQSESLYTVLLASNLKPNETYPADKHCNSLDLHIPHQSSNSICSQPNVTRQNVQTWYCLLPLFCFQ